MPMDESAVGTEWPIGLHTLRMEWRKPDGTTWGAVQPFPRHLESHFLPMLLDRLHRRATGGGYHDEPVALEVAEPAWEPEPFG